MHLRQSTAWCRVNSTRVLAIALLFTPFNNPVVGRHCSHFTEEETEAQRVNDLFQVTGHGFLEPELLAQGQCSSCHWDPGRGSQKPCSSTVGSVCGGEVWGVRGPGSPPAGVGAQVSARCLCWTHLYIPRHLVHPRDPWAALCRYELVWGLKTLRLVPRLPLPRHLGLSCPCTPLTRMIDWVSWPLGKNIDKWIIALLKGLAAVKKFSILIEVSLAKIEKVGGPLF